MAIGLLNVRSWLKAKILIKLSPVLSADCATQKGQMPQCSRWMRWLQLGVSIQQVPHHRALDSPETTSAAHHHAHVTFLHHSTADSGDNSGSKKTGETYDEQNRNQCMKDNHHPQEKQISDASHWLICLKEPSLEWMDLNAEPWEQPTYSCQI